MKDIEQKVVESLANDYDALDDITEEDVAQYVGEQNDINLLEAQAKKVYAKEKDEIDSMKRPDLWKRVSTFVCNFSESSAKEMGEVADAISEQREEMIKTKSPRIGKSLILPGRLNSVLSIMDKQYRELSETKPAEQKRYIKKIKKAFPEFVL